MNDQVEVMGTIDSGVAAMSWSPDQEIVMFATKTDNLLCMTQDFDILHEQPLFVEGFGEQMPVAVGWGKAETQFRGSAGKMTTAPSAAPSTTLTSHDDMRPRLAWRGDGQYCASLVVTSKSNVGSGQGRVLRVWSREGVLQATGQECNGLAHALAWRPDGSLLAGVQLVGGGAGWEVVFFERNGLRHGEFSLPYPAESVYVRELEWSSDSSLLAVWLEATDKSWSKLQFWTTGNYHW